MQASLPVAGVLGEGLVPVGSGDETLVDHPGLQSRHTLAVFVPEGLGQFSL